MLYIYYIYICVFHDFSIETASMRSPFFVLHEDSYHARISHVAFVPLSARTDDLGAWHVSGAREDVRRDETGVNNG